MLSAADLVHLLNRIARVIADARSIEEGMDRLLRVACDFTERDAGLLGLFDDRGRLSRRITHALKTEVPPQVLQSARERRKPFLHLSRDNGRTIERIVVPIGPRVEGVLVLESPRARAAVGEVILPVAEAVGDVVWGRISEISRMQALSDKLTQVSFSQSASSASVLASSRLIPTRMKLMHAARNDRPVFLQGEEGTETEDLARFLHAECPNRASEPFIAFNVGHCPEHRIQEELFGGVASGSVGQVAAKGCLPAAARGTLFIEKPELMPQDVQDQLAEHMREGATMRLVTCSDQSAPDLVRSGKLTESLAEHLQQVKLVVPPLRSEPLDVSSLVDLILREMGPAPNGEPRTVSERAMQLLVGYPWPNNVRELRQVLEVAAARAGGRTIQPKDLPANVCDQALPAERRFPNLREVEKRHIVEVMGAVKSKREASKVLGIAPSTLYEKLHKYGIQR